MAGSMAFDDLECPFSVPAKHRYIANSFLKLSSDEALVSRSNNFSFLNYRPSKEPRLVSRTPQNSNLPQPPTKLKQSSRKRFRMLPIQTIQALKAASSSDDYYEFLRLKLEAWTKDESRDWTSLSTEIIRKNIKTPSGYPRGKLSEVEEAKILHHFRENFSRAISRRQQVADCALAFHRTPDLILKLLEDNDFSDTGESCPKPTTEEPTSTKKVKRMTTRTATKKSSNRNKGLKKLFITGDFSFENQELASELGFSKDDLLEVTHISNRKDWEDYQNSQDEERFLKQFENLEVVPAETLLEAGARGLIEKALARISEARKI